MAVYVYMAHVNTFSDGLNPWLVVITTNRAYSLSEVVGTYYFNYLVSCKVSAKMLSLTKLPKDFTGSALYGQKGKNKVFNHLASQMEVAEKYIFIVPEYNGSYPGVFKAFIDGLDRTIFTNKKCALVGVSKGAQGCITGLRHLTDIFHYLGMTVYPKQPKLSKIQLPTLASIEEHAGYLDEMKEHVDGFIGF